MYYSPKMLHPHTFSTRITKFCISVANGHSAADVFTAHGRGHVRIITLRLFPATAAEWAKPREIRCGTRSSTAYAGRRQACEITFKPGYSGPREASTRSFRPGSPNTREPSTKITRSEPTMRYFSAAKRFPGAVRHVPPPERFSS